MSSKTDELLALIHDWTRPLLDHDAFRSLTRGKIRAAMDWADDFRDPKAQPREVKLAEPLSQQHDAIMRFYYLHTACERLKLVEFYFRRYPFKNLAVNRYEHLENVCTLFFSGFYIFEERLDKYLNSLNKCVDVKVNVGHVLKRFRKIFRDELRARHDAIHYEPFDDTTIQAVMLRTLLIGDGEDRKSREEEAVWVYRKAARDWARIARNRAAVVQEFLEAIAVVTLDRATFLKTPPIVGSNDLVVEHR